MIIAHLRDSMIILGATAYDSVRVDTSRDPSVPFRLEAMQDADTLWAALTDYGNEIARYVRPAPHALTARLRASQSWEEAGDAAHTIAAWLVAHEERVATVAPDVMGADDRLFFEIRRLIGRYRIEPQRLRTYTRVCRVCGERAVFAEWVINRAGEVAQTEQCTVCHERYEPSKLPTRDAVLSIPEWQPPTAEPEPA